MENEGDDGGAGRCSGHYGGLIDNTGELFGRRCDRCVGYLLGRRGLEAELADPIPFASRDWRPEDAAGSRPGCIEIAAAVLRIEDGAGLVVGEVLEAVLEVSKWIATAVQFQRAGGSIARKLRRKLRP